MFVSTFARFEFGSALETVFVAFVTGTVFPFDLAELPKPWLWPAGAIRPIPYWPAGRKHFVWTKGETILQFHGTGSWSIEYLNLADAPAENE